MNNKIFFLIDFQNDFIQPQGLLSINNPQLINRMQSFVNSLTDNCFDSIIATMDTHFKATWDSTSESKDFPLHCEYGTKGWELAINIKDTLPVKSYINRLLTFGKKHSNMIVLIKILQIKMYILPA